MHSAWSRRDQCGRPGVGRCGQLVQLPTRQRFRAQFAVEERVALYELHRGGVDSRVVSYIGAG